MGRDLAVDHRGESKALAAGIPVARATRVHDGPLRLVDEDSPIVIMEDLNAWKARLHIMVALSITADLEGVRNSVIKGKYGIDVVAPPPLDRVASREE